MKKVLLITCIFMLFVCSSVMAQWYAHGDFNGWDTSDQLLDDGNAPDVTGSDGIYSGYVDTTLGIGIPGYQEYKVADSGWGSQYPPQNARIWIEGADDTYTFYFDTNANTDGWVPSQNFVYWSPYDDVSDGPFTVVGSFNGGEWDPANSANHMTAGANGIYYLDKIINTAGTYEYKAAFNDTWTIQIGVNGWEDNASTMLFTTYEDGEMVRFMLDPEKGRLKVKKVGPGAWEFYATVDAPDNSIGVQRVSSDSSGAVYYSINESTDKQIYKSTDPLAADYTLLHQDNTQANGFQGMCSDSSNNFYAMGESGAAGSGTLVKYDSSGNLVTAFGTSGVVTPSDRMTGMDIMSDDSTLVATTFGGVLTTYDSTTGDDTPATNTGSGNYVRDLAVKANSGGNDFLFLNQSGDLKRISGDYTTVEDWGTGIINTNTSWQVRAGVGYYAADDVVIYGNKDDNQVYVVDATTGDLIQRLGSGLPDGEADLNSGDFIQPSDAAVFMDDGYEYMIIPMAVNQISIYRKTVKSTFDNVKINEIVWDDPSTDSEEFVEIYGPGGMDLTGWTLEFYNGNGGALYRSVPLTAIPADGFLVVSPFANTMVDIQDSGLSIQNGSPDAVVLKDADGYIVDALGYEFYSAGAGGLPGWAYEVGMFGSVLGAGWGASDWSVARALDGYDTENNDRDFVIIPTTPGESNFKDGGLLPDYSNNFDDADGTNYGGEWWGTYVDMTAKAPGGSGLPATSSPQGGNFGCAADTSGGGNMVCFMDRATTDVSLDCYAYLRPDLPSASGDWEEWKIAVRGKVDASAYNTDWNGATGVMWKFTADDTASTLTLVERLNGVDTVHATFPIYGSSNTGWQRLRLDCNGDTIMGVIGGTVGSVSGNEKVLSTITQGFEVGAIGIGYREYLVDNAECAWLSIDALNISTLTSDVVPVELSVFSIE